MIDVSNILTLKAHISNPGTNVLWQIKPKVDLYVTEIEITQRDNTAEHAIAQLIDLSVAATVTAGVGGDTVLENDPNIVAGDILDLSTTTTGHTGSGAGTAGTNEQWSQGFDIRIGGLFKRKPVKLLANTLWAVRFKAAPAGSHNWCVVVELEI